MDRYASGDPLEKVVLDIALGMKLYQPVPVNLKTHQSDM